VHPGLKVAEQSDFRKLFQSPPLPLNSTPLPAWMTSWILLGIQFLSPRAMESPGDLLA
jgi:hypothetical protein